jgi:outer membrane receptor protein involved in Fe transport
MHRFSQRVAGATARLTAALVALALLSVAALAQTETGQITVKASDPQSALVAGATVAVRNTETGRELTSTTNDEGIAVFTNLQPGIYDVTVTATGFAPRTDRAQVTVGGRVSVESKLGVAGVAGETVNIIAGGGVEVNTQTQELADVVSSQQIRELPTITRNPYALVGISGNVSPGDTANQANRGTGFNINGQRSASTNILLDGGENVDTFTATVGQSIPLDAVGEFRVITSNFSAEYGRAAGGIVNVSTRAGTNDFNGSIFAFNRVSRLASNDFDNNARGLPKDRFTRNQFGYAVGGPVKRDKLFFFNSTEWTRVRSIANVINLVPTAQLIAASAPATRAAFANATLAATPTGRTFTVAQVVADRGVGAGAFASLPGNLPALQEVRYTVPADTGAGSPQNTYQTVTRIDWNLSDKTQLYGRYALEDIVFLEGSNASSPYAGFNTGLLNFNQNALLNLTHSFTPNFVSQTKLTYNRLTNDQPLGAAPAQPTFYLRNVISSAFGINIALPGYLPFSPGSAIPFGGPQNVGQLYEDLSWTRGDHTFRFGGTYVYIQDNRTFGAFQNAVANLGTTGGYTQGFNNLVLGQVQQFQVAVDPQGRFFPGETVTLPAAQPSFTRSNRYNEFAVYFNDSWRYSPRLTLNLGLRYEYYGIQHNKDENLDANFYFGSGATEIERVRNGRVFRAPESPVGALWNRDLNNFAPRLGFALDLTGDGRTSVRGGYGIAYERNFGNVTFNVIQNPPNYAVVTVQAGAGGFGAIPIPTNNLGPLGGSSGTVPLPGRLNVRHVNENIRNAYAHFFSLAFEREIGQRTVASVEYSASMGRSLYDLTNPNRPGAACVYLGAAQCFTAANPLALLNTQYFPLNTRGNKGYSNYNALIASLESSNLRNYGLQFTARYTYSSTRDNLSSTFSESNNQFALGLLDPFDPEIDYGFADFDIRHRFSGSFNWDIGIDRWTGATDGIGRQVLGGWTLTGIVSARTGTPFSVYDCTNAAFSLCPRLVPTAAYSTDGSSIVRQINEPNRFSLLNLTGQTPGNFFDPVSGTGEFNFPRPCQNEADRNCMTQRNAFRGPGFWNVDLGLYKNFQITEGTRLQLRAEVYNLFNHANLFVSGGEADISSQDFVPGFKAGRRNVQLAAKFLF